MGAGGAGFPAHIKFKGGAEILIINGAECEPLSHKDEAILENRAADIVVGAAALRDHLGAKDVFLAVKGPTAQKVAGLYGGVKVIPLPAVYPAGDEAVLVLEVAGRRVPAAGLPRDVGVVVSNVETVLNVARALRRTPVTTKWVTVAGAVAKPFTAEVPIGTPAAFLIQEAGGVTCRDYVCFDGGPMMGEEVNAAEFGVRQTTGLLTVLPKDHRIVVQSRMPMEHVRSIAGAACTQCRDCTELCPRYLLGYDVTPHLSMRRFFSWGEEASEEWFGNAAACTRCGLCELYACPMAISPRRVQDYLRRRLGNFPKKEGAGVVHPDRWGRLVPAARLKKRIDVMRFDRGAPLRRLSAEPTRVVLDLRQPYAGVMERKVREGDAVKAGDVVAGPAADDDAAVPLRASITGRVAAADDEKIVIDRAQLASR